MCNTNKRQSAREVCKFEGKQEHIRNSYRAFRNRSQQPISSLRAQLFRISSHISASDVLPVSTSFSLCMCVCVCVSTILYKYRLSRVCIYTRQTFKSVLWENILRRCIPLNRWSCKQLIEMIICWDETKNGYGAFSLLIRVISQNLCLFVINFHSETRTKCLKKRRNFDDKWILEI